MKLKLRTKFIVLLLGISLLPLLSVMSVAIVRLQNVQLENAANSESQIAKSAAENVATFIILQFAALTNVELIFPELFADPSVRELLLDRVLFNNDTFTDIVVTDSVGQEIAHKNRVLGITADDLIDRSEDIEFLSVQEQSHYLSPLLFREGKPFFVIGKAIRDTRNNFLGAIFAKIDARIMQDVVKEISGSSTAGRIYIVDQKGIVIAHPDLSQVLARSDFSEIPIISALIKKDPAFKPSNVYQNELNEKVLGATANILLSFKDTTGTVLKTPWFVIAEQPVSVALIAVYQITRFSLVALFIVLIISIVIALGFTNRIVRPIEQVHIASQQLSRGNLKYRLTIKTGDEIEDLANGFNLMAGKLGASISDLKKEQKSIEAERNKLSLILQGITDAVIAVDKNYTIILFTKAAERITGVSKADAIGRNIHEIFTLFRGSVEIPVSTYCPILRDTYEGVTFKEEELKLVGAKKKEHFVNIVTGSIKGGKEIGLGWVVSIHDITEMHLFERLKGQFVTIAAHQMRTPLSAIKWALAMFEEQGLQKLNVDQKRFFQYIYQSSERMIKLINNLLNAARLEERKLGRVEQIDIAKFLQSAIEEIRPKSIERKVSLYFKKPEGKVAPLHGNTNLLKLIFQNLLQNAVLYTPAGGSVTVTLVPKEKEVEILVQDNGIGIPEEQQQRIFSKFFRASNARTIEADGSGLGLFVVKAATEAHGGSVWFESKENKGTTFHITLPLKPKQAKKSSAKTV